jgi:hypothetical protein
MKRPKIVFPLVVVLLVVTGIAVGDRGIDPVPETHEISTSTTIIAVGHFSSNTALSGEVSNQDSTYTTVYTENTQSSGTGDIRYDKELDFTTAAMADGQSNIQAIKQLSYESIDGGRVYSSESIMVEGYGRSISGETPGPCVFDGGTSACPAFCSQAGAGSIIDMSRVNVRTTSNARFIMKSTAYPVELNHEILVTEFVPGVPSRGSASGFMEILIREGRGTSASLAEEIRFDEKTSVSGEITHFEKLMHFESGQNR